MLPVAKAPLKQEEFIQELKELQRISLLPNGQKEWQYISQPYFMNFLVKLLQSQYTNEQSKIFVATLIGKIYNDKIQRCSCQESTYYMFNLIFSWRIQGKIKYLIKRSIKNVFHYFKQSHRFFQGIFYDLLNFASKYKIEDITESMTFTQQFKPSYLQNSYTFSINFPQNYIDLQYVLIILAQCLFYDSPSDASQEEIKNLKLVSSMRAIHKNIFNKLSIVQNIPLFDYLIDLWQVIFTNLEHNLLNQKNQLQKMAAWSQIPQQFELIFNQKAKRGSMNVDAYNYLLFNENWQDKITRKLVILKENALRMFAQFVSLMSINFSSNGIQYLQSTQHIKNSLNQSIFFMAAQYQSLTQEQLSLSRYILSLTGTLIESQSTITLDSARILFIHVIMPLINNFARDESLSYNKQDEFQQFYNHLNDCCSQQKSETLMTSLCRLIQICVDKCQPFYSYLRRFIKESLIKNSGKFELMNIQNNQQWITQGKYLSNECCFLISSVLSYYSLKRQQDCNWLRNLLLLDYVNNLSEYELVYLYLLLTFQWQTIFSQVNQENEFFFIFPLETNSQIMQYVGLDFLINVKQTYYTPHFIAKFLSVFIKIKNGAFKWTLLTRAIKRCLYHFSQEKMSELLSNFKYQMLSLAQCLSNQLESGSVNIDTSQLYQYLAFCRQISRQHQYIHGKFLVIDQLMSIVSHIKLMNKFWIDDEVVLIAGQVLQCIKIFPSNFIELLRDIIDVFKNSQYQGNGYYHLFSCAIGILTKIQDEQMIMMIYYALQQGISYLAYYPEDMNIDITISLNSHIILMQNFYLVHGPRLNKHQINDVKDICSRVLNIYINKDNISRILSVRAINLKLICDILLQNQYNYYEIFNYAKDKAYFNKYDICLLLYLLQQIKDNLPVQYCKETFLMLLYFLKVGDENGKKKANPKHFQQNNKLNSILNYVQIPVDLQVSFKSQSLTFLNKFKQSEQSTYIIARDYYLRYYQGKQQPLKYFQELQHQYNHKNSFLDGINEMQSKLIQFKAVIKLQDKHQKQYDNDLQEGEIRLKKKNRKILKIKGNKVRGQNEGDSDKSSQPKNLKRNIETLQKCNEQFLSYMKARKKAKRQSLDRTCRERLLQRIQFKSSQKNK